MSFFRDRCRLRAINCYNTLLGGGASMSLSTSGSLFLFILLFGTANLDAFQNQTISLTLANCNPTGPTVSCHWENTSGSCTWNVSSQVHGRNPGCTGNCGTWTEVKGKCLECFIVTYTECCEPTMTMDQACQTEQSPSFSENSAQAPGCDCCP
jgi:hypothetical protein